MSIVFKVQQISYELLRVCEIFENNEIDHMPLKGSVLRKLYPEAWMRNSCDIDILVRPENLDEAVALLVDNLNCKDIKRTPHDVSMWTENGVHLELHFDLLEKDIKKNGKYLRKCSFDCLSQIWESAILQEGKKHHYLMTDSMFYFYHIAHMAKHFENGGCGIKPFIDLWLLDNKMEHSKKERQQALGQGNLIIFYENISDLCSAWFSDGEHTELSRLIDSYIISGGAYGTRQNKVAFGSGKAGNNLNFIKHRIFASSDLLKYYYPKIERRKWLMPFYQVGRWLRIISKGRLVRSVEELKMSGSASSGEKEIASILAEKLGI